MLLVGITIPAMLVLMEHGGTFSAAMIAVLVVAALGVPSLVASITTRAIHSIA